jgi:prepilin-type N-terminal cleavage/methylation domain-containing protein
MAGRGFTLVELLIVVIILGLLAVMVIPAFGTNRHESQDRTFATDQRIFCECFQLYRFENGTWPADQTPGVFPPEMASRIKPAQWTAQTPIGGSWDWDYLQFGVTAGLSVFQPDRTEAEMATLDEIVDDGSIASGSFRTRLDGYIFIIEP